MRRPRRRRSSRPMQTASYSRSTSRASMARTSAVCASSVRATTIRPLVSLSSRCTMPARGTCASFGSRCSSAFCRVPAALPAPGCTTSPAGLLSTKMWRSWWTIVELDLLRRDPRGLLEHRALTSNVLAAENLVLGSQLLAVDEHLAGLDPLLDAGARIVARAARPAPDPGAGRRIRRER